MYNILDIKVIRDYIRMCSDGAAMGWHERNGGNLTYRMREEEVAQCRPFFREEPGEWVATGVQTSNLSGEFFLATGSGKYLRNVELEPQDNICIVQINDTGDSWRIVWGLEHGGRPTSEFSSHLMNHSVKKRLTGGACRVMYHAHPPFIVALSYILPLSAEAFTRLLWKSETECCMVFPQGIGVVPCMVPGGTELAKATCAEMEKYDAVVWAFHGLFASGSDFDAAFGLMHTIEKAARIACIALAANGGRKPRQCITDDDLRAIGRELGLEMNEEILGYRSEEDFLL